MEEWKEYKLGEITTMKMGRNAQKKMVFSLSMVVMV
jgi:hypothetical protein